MTIFRGSVGTFFALLGVLGFGELCAQETPALVNVSTRGVAGTDDNVMIAGFIVEGTAPRKIAIRALGPSLVNYGLQGVLADPLLTLNANGVDVASNDDWQTDATSAAALRAANLAPTSDREPGIVRTLAPGAYTAIVGGKGVGTGVTLVEVNDLDAKTGTFSTSRVINLSTRGRVGVGENVMIMGFIIGGSTARDVLITALAGSLGEFSVSGPLADPKIEIFAAGGQKLGESDDWIDSPSFDTIARTGASPREPLESAMWMHLSPGAYTAVVSGVKGTQGVVLPAVNEVRALRDIRFAPSDLAGRTAKLTTSGGTAPETFDLAFSSPTAVTINGGAAGTCTYSTTSDFRANVTIIASGYTFSGKLQFYRDRAAVFDGTLQKPGGTAQPSGGVMVLNVLD